MDYQNILENSISNELLDLRTIVRFGNVKILEEFLKMNYEKINQIDLNNALYEIHSKLKYERIVDVLITYGADPFSSFNHSFLSPFLYSVKISRNLNLCMRFLERTGYKLEFNRENFDYIICFLKLLYENDKEEFFFEYYKDDIPRFRENNPRDFIQFVYQSYKSGVFLIILRRGIVPVVKRNGKNIFIVRNELKKECFLSIIDTFDVPVTMKFSDSFSKKEKDELQEYYFFHITKNIKGAKR